MIIALAIKFNWWFVSYPSLYKQLKEVASKEAVKTEGMERTEGTGEIIEGIRRNRKKDRRNWKGSKDCIKSGAQNSLRMTSG